MFSTVAVAATLAFGFSVLPVVSSAASIGFYDDAVSDPEDRLRGTLRCTNSGCSFEALQRTGDPTIFDIKIGGLFNPGPGRSEDDERAFANANLKEGDALMTGGNRVDGTSKNMNFSSSALYVVLKIGGGGNGSDNGKGKKKGGALNDLMLIRNTSSGLIDFSWNDSGKAAGLSHYTEFGKSVPPIPLPAGGWLLITALGGLGIAGYRRRKAA